MKYPWICWTCVKPRNPKLWWQKKNIRSRKILKTAKKTSKFKNHQNSKKLLYQNSFLFLWTGTQLYVVDEQPPICICIFIFISYGQPISLFMANFELHFHSSWDDGTHLLFIDICVLYFHSGGYKRTRLLFIATYVLFFHSKVSTGFGTL